MSGTWSRTTLARTVSAGHRRFIDALRAGLQLRDQFPQHDIKVRPKDKARGIALKIAKLRELLAAGGACVTPAGTPPGNPHKRRM